MQGTLSFFLLLCGTLTSHAQLSSAIPQDKNVIVPALVEGRSGEISYGLGASDFSIKDDGVEQQINLSADSDMQPISLAIVIQTGHQADQRLDAIRGLGDLLDSILTSPKDQSAVLTFDSHPHIVQSLTAVSDTAAHALTSVAAGDTGAAMFDALHSALILLDQAPKEDRRIVLLISGEQDHGSYLSSAATIIQDVSSRNVAIYGLTFTEPKKKTLLGTLHVPNPLPGKGNEMQRSPANSLAELTGGDFFRFDAEKDFEAHIVEVTNHIHNTYYLSFQPRDPHPGFHSLQVGVARSKTNIISARSGYWVVAANNSTNGKKSQ